MESQGHNLLDFRSPFLEPEVVEEGGFSSGIFGEGLSDWHLCHSLSWEQVGIYF